jgi:uncharacterized protein with PQ loop repeat
LVKWVFFRIFKYMKVIELLGYVAMIVTLISMTSKNMNLLRILNSIGCVLWMIYGIIRNDNPVILVNSTILIIHLVSLYKTKRNESLGM